MRALSKQLIKASLIIPAKMLSNAAHRSALRSGEIMQPTCSRALLQTVRGLQSGPFAQSKHTSVAAAFARTSQRQLPAMVHQLRWLFSARAVPDIVEDVAAAQAASASASSHSQAAIEPEPEPAQASAGSESTAGASTSTPSPASSEASGQDSGQEPADSSSQSLKHSFVLVSGAFMMPHPDKVHKGGEDAYFIADSGLCIGKPSRLRLQASISFFLT